MFPARPRSLADRNRLSFLVRPTSPPTSSRRPRHFATATPGVEWTPRPSSQALVRPGMNMLSLRDRGSRFSTLALMCLLGAASCKQEAPSSAAPEQPQAVEVGIITVQPQSVPVLNDLPGRITPTRSAEVRPRVSGIIVERVFKQGATVKAGDVLFKLDSSLFEVERASARALLARAEATAQEARQQGVRAETLMARTVIPREQYDAVVAARQRADAEVASSRAALRRAEINLEYATIRAPIGGRIDVPRWRKARSCAGATARRSLSSRTWIRSTRTSPSPRRNSTACDGPPRPDRSRVPRPDWRTSSCSSRMAPSTPGPGGRSSRLCRWTRAVGR